MNGLKQITFALDPDTKRALNLIAIRNGFTSAREMFSCFALVMADNPDVFPWASAQLAQDGAEMRDLRSTWVAVNEARRFRRQQGRAAE